MRKGSVAEGMPNDPAFEIETTTDRPRGGTLLVGAADPGMAGLTATDYLVTHVETDEIGHVKTRNLPDITPFSDGKPRHPMRLYSTSDSDLTVLISEVFLPVGVADPWADALFDWARAEGVEEIAIPYGASFPHSEQEHTVYHVATDEYRERHFADRDDVPPLRGGFFDGPVGELIVRGLDRHTPPVGTLVTPTHLPGPDLDAALRLLGALRSVYGIDVDESELQTRSEEMKRYYQGLAERMQALQEGELAGEGREYPEDRMYM